MVVGLLVHPSVYAQIRDHYDYLDFVERMPRYELVLDMTAGVVEYRQAWLEGDRAARQILAARKVH